MFGFDEYEGLATFVGVLILIFGFLILMIPVMIYLIQKWTYKNFKELQKLNRKMEQFLSNPILAEAKSIENAGKNMNADTSKPQNKKGKRRESAQALPTWMDEF